MRRLHLATLLFTATALITMGCRQTTGPAGAGPLTPAGTFAPSNPLAPVSAGQGAILNPFGGPTRVTPPTSGSHLAPNNYMGGVAPIGQANTGVRRAGGFASQAPDGVIGSGVEVAGWTETNSNVPKQNNTNTLGSPSFGSNPSERDPRSGGMRTIDLTNAPAPPGYRPATPSLTPQPSFTAPPQPASTWTPPIGTQPSGAQPQGQSFQGQSFQGQSLQESSRTIDAPDPAEFANSLTPIGAPQAYPNGPSSNSAVPRTATAPVQGPSTEPITQAPQGDLPWRRPGTRL